MLGFNAKPRIKNIDHILNHNNLHLSLEQRPLMRTIIKNNKDNINVNNS